MRFGDELQDILNPSYLDGARKLGALADQHQLRRKIDPRNALTVVFTPEGREPKELVVEVADTPPKRARGLMYRTSLRPYQGMLFRFHYLGRQRMWMKNTPLSLDMIFIDSGKKEVVGVVHQTRPYSLEEVGVDGVGDHILEVLAGTARRLRIKRGTKISFRKWKPLEKTGADEGVGFYSRLRKWLLSDDPVKAIRDNWDEIAKEIPELGVEKGVAQDPKSHALDVLGHSLKVVSKAPKDEVTRVAALFHDIGKPATKIVDDKGINQFPNHAHVGAEITAKVLERIGAPEDIQRAVPPLVYEHYISYKPSWSDKKVEIVAKRTGLGVGVDRLEQLSKADIDAHRRSNPHLGEYHEQLSDFASRLRRLGLEKSAEFAPGLPSKTRFEPIPEISGAPTKWSYVQQEHDAVRAGSHLDVRLGDPSTGHLHSWAVKKMPAPGKATYAPMQPTHDRSYESFEGTIPKGTYGAGEVRTARRAQVEVTKASDNEVRFVIPEGRIPEQFVLKRQPTGGGKMWTLHNTTPTRAVAKWDTLIPVGKPSMKSRTPDAVDVTDPGTVLQPKIDGAHVVAVLEGGKPMRLFSHRQAKNETGLIEHTYRDPEYWKRLAPEGLKPTVIRGELWASDKSGKPLPLQDLSGILNSSIPEARKRLSEQGLKLRVSVHGVDRMDGKKVGRLPFERMDQFLKSLVDQVPGLEHIRTARTPAQKKALLGDILAGKHPLTSEGVVEYRTGSPDATKVKVYDPHDVYVREVYEGTRPGEAGGFRFSHTPTGEIVGSVGSGLTRTQRKEMLGSPEKWLGRVAKVKAQERLRSGALRAPVFEGFHSDKGLQSYHELG